MRVHSLLMWNWFVQVIVMEYTWKSGLERTALRYLRPNPFYSGVVNTLIEEQEVRVVYVIHFGVIPYTGSLWCHPHARLCRRSPCPECNGVI